MMMTKTTTLLFVLIFMAIAASESVMSDPVYGPKGKEVVYDSNDQVIRDAHTGKELADCKTDRTKCKELMEKGSGAADTDSDDKNGDDKN